MAIPAKNVLGNPNVTEGNFQIAIEQLRESVIGSGKVYDSANTYMQYDTCVYSGVTYYSKINSNTGNTPSIGTNWGDVADLISSVVHKTGDETIAGIKTFSSNIVISGENAIRGSYGGGGVTSNFASGDYTLASNTTGYQNTANGVSALQSNTTGYSNTANGLNALQSNTTGNYNTANGASALSSNTTGYQNTANGLNALRYNTTGNYNTANGTNALFSNTTGYSNTANGTNALSSNTTYSNISGFGYNAQVTASNQVQLGDASTTTYVYGTVANRSDIRDKADVRDTVLGMDFIKSLRPVDYKWDMREDYKPKAPNKDDFETDELFEEAITQWLEDVKLANITHDGTHKRTRYHHGFIAQEVLALNSDFGGIQDHKFKGGDDVLSIGYDELIAPIVKAIQELEARVKELEK